MKHLLILLLLAGCADATLMPFEVKVPITSRCHVELPAEPAYATPALTIDMPFPVKIKAILSDAELRRGYEKQLKAALSACNDDVF